MTIAAGLVCSDGVIVCADTLRANYRRTGPKVWAWASPYVNVVVSGAGDYVLLKLAKQAIFRRLDALKAQRKPFSVQHQVIEPVIASIHDDHVDKATDWDRANGYGVDLLVGVWERHGKAMLLETSKRACAPVDGFMCVGSGAPVGNYVASTLFSSSLPVAWGRVVGAYLIQQSKAYGADCGGDTNLVVVQDDGQIIELDAERIRIAEWQANRIHEGLGPVLFAAVDSTPEEYRSAFEGLWNAVKQSRQSVTIRSQFLESGILKEMADASKTAKRRVRKSPKRDQKGQPPWPE